MSKKLAGWDRFLFICVGLVLIAGGVLTLAIYFDVPEAHRALQGFDIMQLDGQRDNPWVDGILAIVLVLALILGLALVVANARRRGFNRKQAFAQGDTTIDIAVGRLAKAVAEDVRTFPEVLEVKPRVAMDRSRPTVQWTLKANPTVDLVRLKALLRTIENDFRAAIGTVDVDTRYVIHCEQVT